MDLSFLLEKDFLKTVLSSLSGGLIALVGTVVTIHLQNKSNNDERTKMYCSFYNEQILSLKNYISEIDEILKKDGYISYQHTRQIQMIFELVNKHFDGLVFIDDTTTRSNVRNFFFKTYFDSIVSENHERKTDDLRELIGKNDDSVDKEKLLREIEDFNMRKRDLVLQMKERSANLRPI